MVDKAWTVLNAVVIAAVIALAALGGDVHEWRAAPPAWSGEIAVL